MRGKRLLEISKKELEGLPPELIKQLSPPSKSKDRYDLILAIVKENGGMADVNTILIAIYKKTKTVCKRNTLISSAYRMINKGLLRNVPGLEGTYALPQDLPTRESAEKGS